MTHRQHQHTARTRLIASLMVAVLGVTGVVVVHSHRPPDSPESVRAIGEDNVIHRPYYEILLGLTTSVTVGGVILSMSTYESSGRDHSD